MSLIPPEDDYEDLCTECGRFYIPGWTNCLCTKHRHPVKLAAAVEALNKKIAEMPNHLPEIPKLWDKIEAQELTIRNTEELAKDGAQKRYEALLKRNKKKAQKPPKDVVVIQETPEPEKGEPPKKASKILQEDIDAELDKLAKRWFD